MGEKPTQSRCRKREAAQYATEENSLGRRAVPLNLSRKTCLVVNTATLRVIGGVGMRLSARLIDDS